MANYYMLGADGLEYGPVSTEQLRQWMAEGRANHETQVRPAEGSAWVPLGSVADLTSSAAPFPPGGMVPNLAMAPVPTGPLPLPRPSNHLVFAILTTICCCLPFGVVAIVYATQVDSHYFTGNYAAAQDASGKALMWSLIALVIGLCIAPFIVL